MSAQTSGSSLGGCFRFSARVMGFLLKCLGVVTLCVVAFFVLITLATFPDKEQCPRDITLPLCLYLDMSWGGTPTHGEPLVNEELDSSKTNVYGRETATPRATAVPTAAATESVGIGGSTCVYTNCPP